MNLQKPLGLDDIRVVTRGNKRKDPTKLTTILDKNNYIGAYKISQTLIDFDWFHPHLNHVPQEFKKNLKYLFFSTI